MIFLSKLENEKKRCYENVDVASTNTALNPIAMEISEENYVCCNSFSKGDSRKSREGTTKEPVSNLSSSVM